MGNSAFFEGFGFRGLPKFTRAVGGKLQISKPGIRDFVSSSNYIQKADREFIRCIMQVSTKGTFGHFGCGFTVLPRLMSTTVNT